jgi:hypothetical protein
LAGDLRVLRCRRVEERRMGETRNFNLQSQPIIDTLFGCFTRKNNQCAGAAVDSRV